jgi:hypothetical protein
MQPKEQSGFGKTTCCRLGQSRPQFPNALVVRHHSPVHPNPKSHAPTRINPRLSAEAQLNGAFHYNKSPLAPPGTKVLNHETPNKRRTWAVHGTDDWYFGGAPEHYRCYQVYATKPRAECIAQTVEFFPHNGKMPQLSSAEAAIRAAIDLCWVIQNPAPTSPPSALGNKQMQAIQQLVDVFATMTPKHGELASPLRVQPYQLSISDVQHQQIP